MAGDTNIEVNFLDHPSEVERYTNWLTDTLGSGRPISIDTETGSADKLWTADVPGHLRLYQVGHSNEAWSIPAQQWRGLVEHTNNQVNKARPSIWFANPSYDQTVFHREKLPLLDWSTTQDTVTLHRLRYPLSYAHGLKPAAGKILGSWATAGQDELKRVMRDNGWTWETIPLDCPEYWTYGGMDCCISVQLGEKMLADGGHPWYDVEMEFLSIVHGMILRGIPLDEGAIEIAHHHWTGIIDREAAILHDLGIDSPSKKGVLDTAFKRMGFEPSVFSVKTGDPSYNKMVLAGMQELGGDIAKSAEHLMLHRRYTAWRNSYGRKLLGFMDSNGAVHPDIQTMEARTGRMIVRVPPMQTIPKDALTRDIFVPRRKGEVLVAADYSSQEVRIMAALSGDEAMISFFEGEGGDYHQYVADLAGIPRQAAKTVNYARAYGAGDGTMARQAGVTEAAMRGYLEQIDAAFPRAMRWKDEVTAQAEQREVAGGTPWVELPYGTILPLDRGKEYTQSANTIIQGHGAGVLKLATIRMKQVGLEEYLVLPFHDEMLVSVPEGDAHRVQSALVSAMYDDLLRVPLVAEATQPMARFGDSIRAKDNE